MRVAVVITLLCIVACASAIHNLRRARAEPAGTTPGSPIAKSVEKKWPNFEVKDTSDKKFHLVLKAGNGETVVTSEVLEKKGSARKTIKAICRGAFNPSEVKTKDKPFMFNLQAKNGEIYGTSETYSSKDALAKGIQALTKAAVGFLLKFVTAAEANKEPGKPSVNHFQGKGDSGKFYAHIKAGNNQIILNTVGAQSTRDAALENLAEIIGHGLSGSSASWRDVEQKESNGETGWRGILLNDEKKEIGRTEVYKNKSDLEELKSKTLPKTLSALFKAYWKNVIQDETIKEGQDDADSAPAPSSASPDAPGAPSSSKAPAPKEEEEEF